MTQEEIEFWKREHREREAAEFWENAKMEVWRIACAIGLEEPINRLEDEPEYERAIEELYDYGEGKPCVRTIAEAVREITADHFGRDLVYEFIMEDLDDYFKYVYK